MGRRQPPSDTYICSADSLPVGSPYPPVWWSTVDATNEEAGISCTRVLVPFARPAARAIELLHRLTS